MWDLSGKAFGPLLLPGNDQAALRVLREDDVTPAYVDGMNDPDIRRFVSVDQGKLGRQAIAGFVRDNWQGSNCLLLGLFVAGVHRGNVRLHNYDGTSVWLGIALFDRSIWGRGFGSRAIATASNFALHDLSCHSVQAGVDRENEVSAGAFRKAGFVISEEKPDGFVLVQHRDAPSAC